MMNTEYMICTMCLVSLLLLSWAILLHIRVNALEAEVKVLKNYIKAEKKLNIGVDVKHPSTT